jgi:acyl-homoserine-lactone acylase
MTPLDQLPHVLNPSGGWLYNSNNWPYTAAGADSPKQADYPKYMDTVGQTPRGQHAERVLGAGKAFTPETLRDAAFDPYMPAFARLIPTLVKAWDALPESDPRKAKLKGQIALLRDWDFTWSDHSLATSLAVFWGDALLHESLGPANAQGINAYDYMADHVSADEKLKVLAEASDRLQKDFGNWRTPWGEINRFQRVNDALEQQFDDNAPSIAVPFPSAIWGSLASFGAKRYPNTKRYYGTSGNSFVAIIEFGPKIRAIAVTAGGESGDPKSPHFNDEAIRYARGRLRPVYFYPEDLTGHIERSYRPGE